MWIDRSLIDLVGFSCEWLVLHKDCKFLSLQWSWIDVKMFMSLNIHFNNYRKFSSTYSFLFIFFQFQSSVQFPMPYAIHELEQYFKLYIPPINLPKTDSQSKKSRWREHKKKKKLLDPLTLLHNSLSYF